MAKMTTTQILTGIKNWAIGKFYTQTQTYTKTEVDTAVGGKYTKPSGGIPKTDLTDAVQTSLGKADTALQSHTPQDDAPTENSTNNVKSGGVWSAIQNARGNELLVIAEALNSLYADYMGLAQMLATNLGETKAECIDFRYMPKVCGQPLVIEGAGAPSVLPYFVGQRYHDTTNKKCYEAFAVTGATSDWTLLN